MMIEAVESVPGGLVKPGVKKLVVNSYNTSTVMIFFFRKSSPFR
jgi:hypothetical protein